MNEKVFREYDIRGTYPTDINENFAFTLGKSYGSYIKEKYNQTKCVISRDNRLSSSSLSDNLVKGLLESGCSVIDYGVTTTPMNFYARYLNQLFGIMITASHNPKDDNGFKFSFGGPSNAAGQLIEDFKNYTFKGVFQSGTGVYEVADIKEKYIEYMKTGIELGAKKIKIVVDPGNGATTVIINEILNQFNIEYELINGENDGTFPNHHPDPAVTANLVQLQKKVLETKADLGIAYDGDGDRIGFVKNNGEFMSTEEFMILMIRNIAPTANNKTFLYDVKCSKVLEEEIKKIGATPFMYRTGASYTQLKTHEDNLAFGGEFSGHVFFRDKVSDIGSAIYASLRLVEILSKTNKTISELTSDIPKYFITEELKITTKDEIKFNVVDNVKNHCKQNNWPLNEIDGVKVYFNEGWALVRASNTGPNLILRAEANTEKGMNDLKNYFSKLIETYNK